MNSPQPSSAPQGLAGTPEKNYWVPLPGIKGYVRNEWKALFADSQLQEGHDFFEVQGDSFSKPGLGGRYRARLQVGSDRNARTVYLKRFRAENKWGRFKRWCEDGRWLTAAERELHAATALQSHGLPVPSVLAWGVTEEGGKVSSFVVLSEVPGIAAQHWAAALKKSDHEPWSARKRLVTELARIAADFHEGGWCHRDFYLCHWFVAEDSAHGLGVSLIDLQRVFRPRWRFGRWRVKDLAQLNYSAAPDLFTNTMRLRFAHRYFGTRKLSPAQKVIVRRVLAKTRAIARRDQCR